MLVVIKSVTFFLGHPVVSLIEVQSDDDENVESNETVVNVTILFLKKNNK